MRCGTSAAHRTGQEEDGVCGHAAGRWPCACRAGQARSRAAGRQKDESVGGHFQRTTRKDYDTRVRRRTCEFSRAWAPRQTVTGRKGARLPGAMLA
eukprot:scaffold21750_cov52-Phaeocystis_antarctica.AAC.7